MKGIVFTEFLEMVENKFGLAMVDHLIQEGKPASGGIYTSVGTYDFQEMIQLIDALSQKTGIPVNDLIYAYGLFFFEVLKRDYHGIMARYEEPMEMIADIENHIHVQVKKIYPDAELPTFEILGQTNLTMRMIYTSSRCMYRFAHALIEKTFAHFGHAVDVQYDLLEHDGSKVLFKIKDLGEA